jgi:hypothetical protein
MLKEKESADHDIVFGFAVSAVRTSSQNTSLLGRVDTSFALRSLHLAEAY